MVYTRYMYQVHGTGTVQYMYSYLIPDHITMSENGMLLVAARAMADWPAQQADDVALFNGDELFIDLSAESQGNRLQVEVRGIYGYVSGANSSSPSSRYWHPLTPVRVRP